MAMRWGSSDGLQVRQRRTQAPRHEARWLLPSEIRIREHQAARASAQVDEGERQVSIASIAILIIVIAVLAALFAHTPWLLLILLLLIVLLFV